MLFFLLLFFQYKFVVTCSLMLFVMKVSIGWHNYQDSHLMEYIDDKEVRIDFFTVGVALLIASEEEYNVYVQVEVQRKIP